MIKPILFNTDMVQAILDGRKTVTRRCVKAKSKNACGFFVTTRKSDGAFMGVYDYDENEMMYESPQTQPAYKGDILYVRETWKYYEKAAGYGEAFHIEQRIAYKADENRREIQKSSEWYDGKWCPSIHMPKEAARIWLKVTDVRVERLQEITVQEIQREGLLPDGYISQYATLTEDLFSKFKTLWNSTIKKTDSDRYGWNANPWVWVIEFERCKKPDGWCL